LKKHKDIEEILYTEKEISEKIIKLAKEISKDYEGKVPVLVCVLKGSVMFLSDLMKYLKIDVSIDFIGLSSYEGSTESTGIVRMVMDLKDSIYNKDVIVVEDIVDTGLTVDYLIRNLLTRKPKSLKICVLFDKEEARKIKVPVDYRGFTVPNKFLVGYGLDYNELYRNLPYVGVLKRSVYKK